MPHAEEFKGRGVDLEIWEDDVSSWALGTIRPYRVKINGVEVCMPDVRNLLELGNVNRKESLTATLTVFVNSLTIHAIKPEDATS